MNTTQIKTATEGELVAMLNKSNSDIRWAEAAGRSTSTLNRLWQKHFRIEDQLKFFKGGF